MFATVAFAMLHFAQGQGLFNQRVSDSNPLRAEQARELDAYIKALATDKTRLNEIFRPDYSNDRAYERSVRKLRQKFADSIGYPPPGKTTDQPTFTLMGDDAIGTYYRTQIPILPGVNSEGIYIVPKGAHGKVPLIISMHGGGGSPEVALFNGGANYHDMVRGGVQRGYAVYAPQHLFSAQGYSGNIRNQIDTRLRLVGTTISAVEIAKITRAIDVLVKRPEIDSNRIAMVGLSYGGYYAVVAPALDTRIKVVVSSCYFGVQEFRYEHNELSVPSDFQSPDRFSLFRDSEIAALICPRALLIQAGKGDDDEHREGGVKEAPLVAEHYRKLGKSAQFEFLVFDGGHEFHDASAWSFIKRFL